MNLSRGRAPRRDAADPPHGQEGWQAAWLLQGDHLHRPDHARRRRHAGPRAPALRQGAPAGARRSARGARRRPTAASPSARSASITRFVRDRGRGARRARAFPSPRSRPAFRPASSPLDAAARGDRGVGRPPARARSTSSSRARTCSTGNWQALYDEVRAFREACGDAHMKAILAHRRAQDAPQRLRAPAWCA